MFAKIKLFFQESKQEFKKVNWPSGRETVRMTAIVVGMSIGVAVFLGFLDMVFTYLLEKILL